MKAIMVMFDSLNRHYLPPYGNEWVHAPNFERLAERTVTFENCYAGSMPCMPARRELHTGRYNFLHRSWGPLEPFDDSIPEMLKAAGVYTHLVTDHQHYWEDGGATYHNRYNSYELFRGQEGDPWKGRVADPPMPEDLHRIRRRSYRQDWVNRQYLADESDHPQTKTFDAGLHFVEANAADDNWFVQIETFDPHEPFFSYERHKKLYEHEYDGPHFDWPDYAQVLEDRAEVDHGRAEYAALLSMCDESLGRVLEAMDRLHLWDDTMLIVCTDHGLLLGEHGWWGKNVPPWYDETIHTPLFVWDPRVRAVGVRRDSVVQTIDLGPTLLDCFGVEPTADMQGQSIRAVLAENQPIREAGLFGGFGGHVNVTDGRYVYMRAPVDRSNAPLAEYTLMPTHMMARFDPAELRSATLADPFDFTKGVPTLRVGGFAMSNPYVFGTLLFDLHNDPNQQAPLIDDEVERRMVRLLVELMRATDAPLEQYARLGLPPHGDPDDTHLQIRAQWHLVELAAVPVRREDFPDVALSVNTPLDQLLQDARARGIVEERVAGIFSIPMLRDVAGRLSLVEIAATAVGLLPRTLLGELSDRLTELGEPVTTPSCDRAQ